MQSDERSPAGTPFTYRRMVHFAETDMAGVMHFSNYFRLMEECEHAWWRSIGLTVYMTSGPKLSWPRVSVSCDYSAPARLEELLDLTLSVTALGEKSVEFRIEFLREGKRIAAGRMKVVCCTMHEGRFGPVPIPADIREKIAGAQT